MKKNVGGHLKVKKKTLLLVAAIVWAAAGVNILRIGIEAVITVFQTHRPLMSALFVAGAILVFVGFFFMFRKVVNRHAARILGYQEEKKSIFLFFDLKGYLLMAFMMGMGIVLRRSGFAPTEFFASFYTGLGSALSVGGLRFLLSYIKA